MKNELPIISFDLHNQMDIMLAHRRAMQFAKFSGLRLAEQTRFATAISEICRNAVEYAEKGKISFSIIEGTNEKILKATISDNGAGIKELEGILERLPETHKGRGLGIVYAQRLSDEFSITSSKSGTTVTIHKAIPPGELPLNKLIIQGWISHISNEPVVSAYEELKVRNAQLIELTEELIQNNKIVELQMEQIKKLNVRLAQSNDRMKEFTFAISHDLKTPLSSLKLSTDYLEKYPQAPDTSTYQQIQARSIARINKTINSLTEILDFQAVEKQISRTLRFDEIFRDVQGEYEQFIADSQAIIKTDFSQSESIIYIEAYLISIFHNLLSNAIKYRDPNRQLVIEVSTKRKEDKLILFFSDNGTGMDLLKIGERLFLPFTRFSDGPEGKGIGLYLIKHMVQSNGGSVLVESKPGKGTLFTFELRPYNL